MLMDVPTDIFEQICNDAKRGISRQVLESVIVLAVEIAREGREGRKIGTMFVVGDTEAVLRRSRTLILDPLAGHSDDERRLTNGETRETLKELAQLDGAFIVNDHGIVVSACRYVSTSLDGIKLPLGLGSRHMAAASITRDTDAVAVVVSESSVIRIFDNGELIGEIIPELWMLSRHNIHFNGPYLQRTKNSLTVVSKPE
jgi:DNA integrity scanning protein DisA with diadenylate cyclase activity